MAATQLDSVRRLEAEFAEAMTRMYAVGNGLAALRIDLTAESLTAQSRRGPSPAAAVAPLGEATARPATTAPERRPTQQPVTPPRQPDSPESGAPESGVPKLEHPRPEPPRFEPPKPQVQRASWWEREGMVVRLLGVAGAGVLLIGVALLVTYAIQHGYLGPVARVTGAGILAAGLIAFAGRVHRDPQRASGALAIASAGYATAYLDVMAVTTIYDWLPAPAGLVLAAVVGASGIILARAWNSQFLALVTVGGVAALAPVIGSGRTLLTAAFLVVLAITAYPAHIGHSWFVLHAVRVLPAVAALLAVLPRQDQHADVVALAAVLAGFELGTGLMATRRPEPTLLAAVLPLSALPLFATADRLPVPAWLIFSAAALVYSLAAVAARGEHVRDVFRLAPWAGAVGTAFAAAAVDAGTSPSWRTSAIALLALAYAASARGLGTATPSWHTMSAIVLTTAAVVAALPTAMLMASRHYAVTTAFVDHVVTFAAVVCAVAFLRGPLHRYAARLPHENARLLSLLTIGLGLAFAVATVVAGAVVLGRRIGTAEGGFVTGQALVTLGIAVGAAYLLMHGLRRSGDAGLALRAGLALAAVAVGKLLFYDLAALDGIVRIAAFIGAGLALLAMGTGYAKALERSRTAPTPLS